MYDKFTNFQLENIFAQKGVERRSLVVCTNAKKFVAFRMNTTVFKWAINVYHVEYTRVRMCVMLANAVLVFKQVSMSNFVIVERLFECLQFHVVLDSQFVLNHVLVHTFVIIR